MARHGKIGNNMALVCEYLHKKGGTATLKELFAWQLRWHTRHERWAYQAEYQRYFTAQQRRGAYAKQFQITLSALERYDAIAVADGKVTLLIKPLTKEQIIRPRKVARSKRPNQFEAYY